jgi:hypothetical protein
MDVKTVFLNDVIEEEVYIEKPQGLVIHGKESHVCRLKKVLYELKWAPKARYSRIDGYFMSLDFTKSDANPNIYYNVFYGDPLILVLYVDDLFLTGVESLIVGCKREFASTFEMKDLGLMHYFLGLEVWHKLGEIFLGKGKYRIEILSRFGMMDCNSMATPMLTNLKKLSDSTSYSDLVDPTIYKQLIGSLMYLVNTRPNICFAVSTLGQFMVDLREFHWVATKHVLRYLHGTIGYGLRYFLSGEVILQRYTNSDWERSAVDKNSTLGCCVKLGSAMISWISRKQNFVALSTTEADYIAASVASREVVWLQKLLARLLDQELETTLIHCDNQSCLNISYNPVFHDRSKHI